MILADFFEQDADGTDICYFDWCIWRYHRCPKASLLPSLDLQAACSRTLAIVYFFLDHWPEMVDPL